MFVVLPFEAVGDAMDSVHTTPILGLIGILKGATTDYCVVTNMSEDTNECPGSNV